MLFGAVLLWSVFGAMSQTTPQSPCPEVFEYVLSGGQFEGVVTAPAPELRGTLTLTVKLFTTAILPDGNAGSLSRLSGTENFVLFRLELPSQQPLSTIDEVLANGVTICTGPEVRARSLHRSTITFTLSNYHPTNSRQPPRRPVSRPTPTKPAPTQPAPTQPTPRSDKPSKTDAAARDCGVAEVSLHQPLIAFGMPTDKGEWPWLAAIFDYKTNDIRCGGSLLDLRHVLTAGHCVQNRAGKLTKENEIYVIMGKFNLKTVNEDGNQLQDISRIRLHPSYKYRTFSDDIALLTLQSAVTYTQFVRPICLWKTDFPEGILISKEAAVVGWGRDEKGNMNTEQPEMAKAPIVSLETCRDSDTNLVSITNEKTLCAGYRNGTGPCTGDSGGGLMLPNPNDRGADVRYYLQGIVSVALKKRGVSRDCDLHHYVVYTNVNKYLEWLRKYVVENYS